MRSIPVISPRPAVLTVALAGLLGLAPLAAPLAGAELSRKDFDKVIGVPLSSLRTSPESLMGTEVRFRCTYIEMTDLFDLDRTNFRPDRFSVVAVWGPRNELWTSEGRGDILPSIYLPKSKISSSTRTKLRKYQQLELIGQVKDVVDGVPQIEVSGLRQVDDDGAFTDQAIYHIEQANLLAADSAFDLADEHFAQALAVDLPVYAQVAIGMQRGRSQIAAGRFDAAQSTLSSALAQAERDRDMPPKQLAELHALHARSLSELAERGTGGSHSSAVDHAKAALALDPANGEAYAVLGISLAGLGRYDEARKFCDNAVRLRPSDAVVRWYLGRILDQQGRHDEAIEALRKAIDLTPKDHRIHKAIASAYHHRGRQGGASAGQDLTTSLREYDITLRLQPTDADALWMGAEVIESAAAAGAEVQIGAARQPATRELAIARYRSATQAHPKSVPAWRGLGLALAASGAVDEARQIAGSLNQIGASKEAAEVQAAVQAQTAPVSAPAPVLAPAPAAVMPAPAPVEPVQEALPTSTEPVMPAVMPAVMEAAPVEVAPAEAAPVPAAADQIPMAEDPSAPAPAEALPQSMP
jgi:tetratricopeptide (TPR) repeat protein